MKRVLFLSLLLLTPLTASAQDQPRYGMVIGYPGAVGFIWEVTDRIAIRPEIDFSHTSTESDSPIPRTGTTWSSGSGVDSIFGPLLSGYETSSSSTNVGIDLNVLFTINKWEQGRTYLMPFYGYRRSTTKSEISINLPLIPGLPNLPLPNLDQEFETSADLHSGGLALGMQFNPHRRIGVFGEIGFRYASGSTGGGVPMPVSGLGRGGDNDLTSVSRTAVLGAIFYF